MKFDFDTVIDRRGTGSVKWDKYLVKDIIPLWVADMDFAAPPEVIQALRKHIDHGIFGYSRPQEELLAAAVDRLKKKYDWEIDPAWIVWLPGVVSGLHLACRAVGNPGDEVMTFVPIYPPFLTAPVLSQRKVKTIPVVSQGDSYVLDLERMKKEITEQSRLFLFCNPHNPVGRVYCREEIQAVADICLEHEMILCSDEIHCDLILDDKEHIPTASLGREIAEQTITLLSPSKTFNLAGLNCAWAVIPNKRLRDRFNTIRKGIVPGCNALGFTACLAAYCDGEGWRKELIEYLRQNRDRAAQFIKEEIPSITMNHVEATYLAWLDVRRLGTEDPVGFFEQAGVGLSEGRHFRGTGYVRLNFGCPRSTLEQALERIKKGCTKR